MLKAQRNRRIAAAASFGIFQRVVQMACTLLLMPILLHVLGAAHFGIWGAAASLAWTIALVDIGTGSALVTLVARSMAHNDVDKARNEITGALTIGCGIAILFLASGSIAWIGGAWQGSAAPYLIAFTGLAVNVPLSAANNVWLGLQKGHVASFWELVQTVATTFGLIGAAKFTDDVRAYVAIVYAGLVVSHLGSLIHLFWRQPQLRPRISAESKAAIRDVAGSGILFFILGITGSLSFMLDNVLALQLLGPEASASMTIAMRICMTAIGLLAAFSQPFWPAFADAAHKADRKWIRRGLLRGSVMIVGIATAGSFILLVFGERLLRLWLRSNLGIGSLLLWAISGWILTQALIRVPLLLLNGLSLIRFQIGLASISTIVAFILKFILVGRLGIAGILWGTSIAVSVIALPATLWRIYRWADCAARTEKLTAERIEAGRIAPKQL